MFRFLYLLSNLYEVRDMEVDIDQDMLQDHEGQEELNILIEEEDPIEDILDLRDDLTQAETERSVQILQDNPQEAEQALASDETETLEHTLTTHTVPGRQTKWGGTNMNLKADGSLRIATQNVESSISETEAHEIAADLLIKMKDYEIDILIATETAIAADSYSYSQFEKELNANGYTCITSAIEQKYKRGQGVIAIIRPKLGAIENIKTDGQGRSLAFDIGLEIEGKLQNTTILGLYASQNHWRSTKSAQYKNAIKQMAWIKENCKNTHLIACGDFNAVMDTIDDCGKLRVQVDNNMAYFIRDTMKMSDTYREINPNHNFYSRHMKEGGSARLDYICIKGQGIHTVAAAIMKVVMDKSSHMMMVTDVIGIEIVEDDAEIGENKSMNWAKLAETLKGKPHNYMANTAKAERLRIELQEHNTRDKELINKLNEAVAFLVEETQSATDQLLSDKPGKNAVYTTRIKIKRLIYSKIQRRASFILTQNIEKRLPLMQEMHDLLKEEAKWSKKLRKCFKSFLDPNSNEQPKGINARRDDTIKNVVTWASRMVKKVDILRRLLRNHSINMHREKRKRAARKGDTKTFFRLIKGKIRGKSGYVPKSILKDEEGNILSIQDIIDKKQGQHKAIRGSNETKLASVQEQRWMYETHWPPTSEEDDFIIWDTRIDTFGHKQYDYDDTKEPKDEFQRAIKQATEAIRRRMTTWEIEGKIRRPIEDRELNTYISKSQNKAPGKSAVKIATICNMSTEHRNLVKELTNKMLIHGVIPTQWANTIVAHIPKKLPGQTRPLGLIEECIKLTTYVQTSRAMYSLTTQGANGLNPINTAYKQSQGCAHATTVDMLNMQWAHREGVTEDILDAIVRFEWDLESYFDGIRRETLDMTSHVTSAPPEVRNLWTHWGNSVRYEVATEFGLTPEIPPNCGVVQGAMESPLRSLINLEIWYEAFRILTKGLLLRTKQTTETDSTSIQRSSQWGYADDGGTYARHRHMQKILDIIGELSTRLCICIKLKKVDFFSYDSRIVKDIEYRVTSWSWKESKITTLSFKVKDANTIPWTTLGTSSKGDGTDGTQQDIIGIRMTKNANALSRKDLSVLEMRYGLQALWTSHMSHNAILFCTSITWLKQKENERDAVIRKNLKISEKTPTDGYGAKLSDGGLEMPSIICTRIKDLAREYFTMLNEDSIAGNMLRKEFDDLSTADNVTLKKSVMAQNLMLMAGFGIYIRDMSELTISRMLDEMSIEEDPAAMTKHLETSIHTKAAKQCSISNNATALRKLLNARDDPRRFDTWKKHFGKTSALKWHNTYKKVMKQAETDAKGEAYIFGENHENICDLNGYTEIRVSAISRDESRTPIIGDVFTDGATQDGKDLPSLPNNRPRQGVGAASVWQTYTGLEVHREMLPLPQRYGNKDATAQMAEKFGVLNAIRPGSTSTIYTDSLVTCHAILKTKVLLDKGNAMSTHPNTGAICDICYRDPASGYLIERNLATCSTCFMTTYGPSSSSRDNAGRANAPIAARIQNLKRKLDATKTGQGPNPALESDRYNEGFSSTQNLRTTIGLQSIVKIKAHQKEDYDKAQREKLQRDRHAHIPEFDPKPNAIAVRGNARADLHAGEAAIKSANDQIPAVKYPWTDTRFNITYLGEIIMDPPGRLIDDMYHESQLQRWLEPRLAQMNRHVQLRNKSWSKAMNIENYGEIMIPTTYIKEKLWDHEILTDVTKVLFKIRMGTGGSWKQLGYTNEEIRIATEENSEYAERLGKECPICNYGEGNSRHYFYSCRHTKYRKITKVILDNIEKVLEANTDATTIRNSITGAITRENSISDERARDYPLLSCIGWLLKTNDEKVIEENARTMENEWNTAHKAIIPAGMASLFKNNKEEVMSYIANTLAAGLVILRKHVTDDCIKTAKKHLCISYHSEKDEEEEEAAKAKKKPDVPPNTLPCTGELCKLKEKLGIASIAWVNPGKNLGKKVNTNRRKILCQSCYKEDQQDSVRDELIRYALPGRDRYKQCMRPIELTTIMESLNNQHKTTKQIKLFERGLTEAGSPCNKDGYIRWPLAADQAQHLCACEQDNEEFGPCDDCMGQGNRADNNVQRCTKCSETGAGITCGSCAKSWHENCRIDTNSGTDSYICPDCMVLYARKFYKIDRQHPSGKWLMIKTSDIMYESSNSRYPGTRTATSMQSSEKPDTKKKKGKTEDAYQRKTKNLWHLIAAIGQEKQFHGAIAMRNETTRKRFIEKVQKRNKGKESAKGIHKTNPENMMKIIDTYIKVRENRSADTIIKNISSTDQLLEGQEETLLLPAIAIREQRIGNSKRKEREYTLPKDTRSNLAKRVKTLEHMNTSYAMVPARGAGYAKGKGKSSNPEASSSRGPQ